MNKEEKFKYISCKKDNNLKKEKKNKNKRIQVHRSLFLFESFYFEIFDSISKQLKTYHFNVKKKEKKKNEINHSKRKFKNLYNHSKTICLVDK